MLLAKTGKTAKTHTGLRTALAGLLRGTSGDDRELLTFLARAYKYKELSDYAVGLSAQLTLADAEALIEGAAQFHRRVSGMLSEPPRAH